MHSQPERGAKSALDRLRSAQERPGAADPTGREAVIDENSEHKSAHQRAAFYRKRAQQISRMLERMKDPQARALIEQTIRNYEHLALLVEERSAERLH